MQPLYENTATPEAEFVITEDHLIPEPTDENIEDQSILDDGGWISLSLFYVF